MNMLRPRPAAITAAMLAIGLAGCGSHPAAASGPGAPAAHHRGGGHGGTAAAPGSSAPASGGGGGTVLPKGRQGSRGVIPWARVGPGWILSSWVPSTRAGAPETLFLIDPAGGRYQVARLGGGHPPSLIAWSADGQRALLGSNGHYTVLDLRSGTAVSQFRLAQDVTPTQFTMPNGLAILAETGQAGLSVQHLERLSLSGAVEQTYPASFGVGNGKFSGGEVSFPDGTKLVVGVDFGVAVISNSGQFIQDLVVPSRPGYNLCQPVRWYQPGRLLVGCVPKRGPLIERLFVFSGVGVTPPPPGPAALTARPAAKGDYGDLAAWDLTSGGGTYVQDAGACGSVYVAKLTAGGRTQPVAMPAPLNQTTNAIVGATPSRLAILASTMGCHPEGALLWFAPGTGSVQPVLGGSVNGGDVTGAQVFGQR